MSAVIEGQKVRFRTIVKDHINDDVLVDPPSLTLTLEAPDGTSIVFTYPDDVEVVRDELGRFHVDRILDQPQRWVWRWETAGGAYDGGIAEGKQLVRPSLITPAP
jgi:hypothetical protein